MKFIVLFDLYYDINEEMNFMYGNFIERESDKNFLIRQLIIELNINP